MTNTNEISVGDVQNYQVTYEDIEKLLDKRYTLFYADYRDNLDESMEEIQECIQNQDWSTLWERVDEWVWEAQDYSIDYIYKELISEIEREFEVEEEEAEEILQAHWEEIRQEIQERDDSDPLKDLLRNTSDPVMFYDTGVEIYDGCLSDEKEMKEKLKEVKKALKIKLSETKYDDKLWMMIRQGDKGRLVVYFRGDINQMMDLTDKTIVTFSDPHVAIIDTWDGAGDDCELNGHKFTIPFTVKNFFIDKCIKYSYTYEVCGMSSNWCEGTGVHFGKKKVVKPKESPLSSELHNQIAYEKKCDETYRNGGCTPMDMDMRRHRKTYYLNEFPCGTHCKDCGTFWID